jgi:hypothetical protein
MNALATLPLPCFPLITHLNPETTSADPSLSMLKRGLAHKEAVLAEGDLKGIYLSSWKTSIRRVKLLIQAHELRAAARAEYGVR